MGLFKPAVVLQAPFWALIALATPGRSPQARVLTIHGGGGRSLLRFGVMGIERNDTTQILSAIGRKELRTKGRQLAQRDQEELRNIAKSTISCPGELSRSSSSKTRQVSVRSQLCGGRSTERSLW
jgi:hypothetical protein